MKKTLVVNLYGSSGSGKTTTSMLLTAAIKNADIAETFGGPDMGDLTVELVREEAKRYAWAGTPITASLQQNIGATQVMLEQELLGKVDILVTDSPVLLSPFYEKLHLGTEVGLGMVRNHIDKCRTSGHDELNIFLNRNKPFVSAGRYETEEQSDEVSVKMADYLTDVPMTFLAMEETKDRVGYILGIIKHVFDVRKEMEND